MEAVSYFRILSIEMNEFTWTDLLDSGNSKSKHPSWRFFSNELTINLHPPFFTFFFSF